MGLSKTTAGVCLNEVLIEGQVYVKREHWGSKWLSLLGREVWTESFKTNKELFNLW